MLSIKKIAHVVISKPLLIFIIMLVFLSPKAFAFCETGVCLQAGPRLASVDTQQSALLNPILSGLLGANISLSVLDWNALAGGDISLLEYLNVLKSDLTLSGTDQVLFTDLTLLQLISAAKNVAQSDGNNDLANALGLFSVLSGLTNTIKLGDLLKIDLQDGTLADTELNALNLLTGFIQLYNYKNVLTTPAPITLDGSALSPLGLNGIVNSVELYLQVVEPPIYTCGPVGTSFHTAAIRAKLNLDLVNLSPDSSPLVGAVTGQLSGLVGLDITADIQLANIDLYLEVARAEGTLTAIDAIAGTITVQATPGLVDIYLGSINDNLFFNRTHIIDPTTDVQPGVIGTLDLKIKQNLVLSTLTLANIQTNILAHAAAKGEAPFADTLVFSGPYPQTKTGSSSANFANVLITDLVNDLTLSFSSNLGLLDTLASGLLEIVKTSLTSIVNNALSPILEVVLTQLVDPLLRLLGISIGEVDVTVISHRRSCTGVTVSGRVFLDANTNATNDSGEAGVAQLPIVLYDIQNTQCVSTQTNAHGYYQFGGVAAGNYQLYEASGEAIPIPKGCDPSAAKDPHNYRSTTSNIRPTFTVADNPISRQDFGDIKPPRLEPNHTGQILPGSVLFYVHRFATPTKGTLTLTNRVSNNVNSGWSSVLYPDNNCDGKLDSTESNAPLSGSINNPQTWISDLINLEAASSLCFINKIYASANVAANDQYQQRITGSLDYGNTIAGTQVLTVQDITNAAQASSSRLTLRKTVQNITKATNETDTTNQAAPGDILEYRIYYRNTGTEPLTDLMIDDVVPAYTELVADSMSCGVIPQDMSCDKDIDQENLQWQFTGALAGGLMGQVSYQVTIDQ